MRFTCRVAEKPDLADTFYCRSRRRQLSMEECLDGYVDANAFERKRCACFRCPQGRRYRETFAEQGA